MADAQPGSGVTERGVDRRRVVTAAAWATPVILVGSAAPAFAASPPQLGVNFDGGGGVNGLVNSVYLNLGVATGISAPVTLSQPVVVTIDVVGLNTQATSERSFSASSSYGSVQRNTYNSTTRTTTIVWTIPAGESLPTVGTSTNVPDLLFSFRDGGIGSRQITNKIVVRSVTGGFITQPSAPPVDSSVVRDVNQSAISPDGIY